MAILGMEGFDHYTTVTDTAHVELAGVENYTTGVDNDSIVATGQRFGTGKYWKGIWDNAYIHINTSAAATNTILISYACKFENSLSSSGNNQIYLYNDAAGWVHVKMHNNLGLLRWRKDDNTVLCEMTTAVDLDTWYWMEHYIVIDSSAGSIETRINGVEVMSYSGNTRNGGTTANISAFRIAGHSTPYLSVDDLVWQDTNNWLEDSRIETFVPTGDASVTWDNSVDAGPPNTVTNASTIDEIPVDDADYVYSNVLDEEDLYTFDTIANNDTVHAISLKYRARKTDTGSRSIQSRTSELITGDDVQGGAERALSTSWSWYSDVFETTDDGTPDTGTAWNKQLIEDATFGIKVTV